MAETDGLLEQLTGFLSSPEGMAQLQSAAQMSKIYDAVMSKATTELGRMG